MIATAGLASTTSRLKRPRISAAVCPSTPQFRTFHSGWRRIIQKAYWLSGFPAPCGGASIGERKPGVPAVVESPMPTIVRTRGDMRPATFHDCGKGLRGSPSYFVWTRRRYACATRRDRSRIRPMYACRSVTEIAPRASNILKACAAFRIIS